MTNDTKCICVTTAAIVITLLTVRFLGMYFTHVERMTELLITAKEGGAK